MTIRRDLDQLAHQLVMPRGALLQRSPVEQPNIVREEELLRGGIPPKETKP